MFIYKVVSWKLGIEIMNMDIVFREDWLENDKKA
jgi:hypothetical protein